MFLHEHLQHVPLQVIEVRHEQVVCGHDASHEELHQHGLVEVLAVGDLIHALLDEARGLADLGVAVTAADEMGDAVGADVQMLPEHVAL